MTFSLQSKQSNSFHPEYALGKTPSAAGVVADTSFASPLKEIYASDGDNQFFRFWHGTVGGELLNYWLFGGCEPDENIGEPAIYKQLDMSNISNGGTVNFYKICASGNRARVLQGTYYKSSDTWSNLTVPTADEITGRHGGGWVDFPEFDGWENYRLSMNPNGNKYWESATNMSHFLESIIEVEFVNCSENDYIEFNGENCITGGTRQPYKRGRFASAGGGYDLRFYEFGLEEEEYFNGPFGITMLNDNGGTDFTLRYSNEVYDTELGKIVFIDGFDEKKTEAINFGNAPSGPSDGFYEYPGRYIASGFS